ncbi:Pentatricopeptide repeat-containing protein [Forsythia ovata]|uniref:Pentatricopeptide repeat-containing protein n=1 Tax=Forsythia ovata TaxID=205694 RepID=A0ABD1RHQ9_9LAMI
MKNLLKFPTNLFADHCLLLQKCIKAKALKPCKQIHGLMLTTRIDMNSLSLSSRLIGAYASCGDLTSAKFLFWGTGNPNVFAFNWMISSLTFTGFHHEAMCYFSLLQESRKNSVVPNKYTFCVVLKACVGSLDMNKGKEVHGMIYKMGFEMDVSVCNALIDMHGKCGNIFYARKVFDRMAEKDIASWTSMICGCANVGMIEESVVLFESMRLEGLEPNDFTWNAMIAGHARSGDCNGAVEFFSMMSEGGLVPDLVTWNAIISGFVQGQRAREALQLFHDMLIAGIKPNQVTVTGLLPACGMIGSIGKGKEIHGLIYRMGLYINVYVASALIDMYSKCGSVKEAWNVFYTTPSRNVASWNAMIGCYGKHGMVSSAIELFEKMQDEEVQANEVTIVSVLSACVHCGQDEKGMEIFRSMWDSYGVEANKEHYACVVDLLCRCGRMEEAYDIVKQMPMEVTDSVVGAFFNGCKIHERRDLAEKMANYLRMDLKKPGGFVTLSNIYASEGDWGEVHNVRKVMKDKRVHKKPGSSWV